MNSQKMLLPYIASYLLFISSTAQKLPVQEALLHPNIEIVTTKGEQTIFRIYDEINTKVNTWNESISTHKTELLRLIYSPNVEYYLNSIPASKCIDTKNKWLVKHPNYTQKIEHLEVYCFETQDAPEEFVAEFDKLCIENGKTTKVHSFLHFIKIGDNWRLNKETDEATEVTRAKKAAISTFNEGHYSFNRNYWSDTRQISGFAHETVPYRTNIEFDISTREIKGTISVYSGTMRSSTEYLIVAGQMTNGIITFDVIYNPNEEYSLDDLDELGSKEIEKWTFKIIDQKSLVGIIKDDSFLIGKTLQIAD